MSKLHSISLALLSSAALGFMLSSCGADGKSPFQESVQQTAPASVPATPQEALAQLDALPVPPGADPAVFAELKSGLRAMLENMPAERLVAKAAIGPNNVVKDLTSGVDDQGVKGIQWNYLNQGDYNFDGLVSVQDLSQIGIHFGKDKDSADWMDSARFADGDGDGRVAISDLTPIGANFLSEVAAYRIESGPGPDGPFTDEGLAEFGSGLPLLTGIRMFHFTPAVESEAYRVIPVDGDGNAGVPSLASTDFKISEKTRIIGLPDGPQYVSHDFEGIKLLLPAGVESPIKVGDVIVGEEQGGYLVKAMEISQSGDELDIKTEPAILTDVFVQGGLSEGLDDLSQVPPEVYTLDLSGQSLCDTEALEATIESGSVSFLPQADVAVNYNEFGGVTYLRGLVKGGPLDFSATTVLTSNESSGPFPASAAEAGFFEHKLTGFTFDFIAYQNGVPVTMALQYDVYVGIHGDGDLFGTYVARCDSTYDALRMGGIFDSSGIADFNEFTASHSAPDEPFVDAGGDSFTFTTYVRPEIHIRLYGNPVPGNTEDLALTLAPQFTFAGTRTATPDFGYDYTINAGIENSFLLVLHHIGLDDQPQSRLFPITPELVGSGFLADFEPPG